jgi:hypothetical protein
MNLDQDISTGLPLRIDSRADRAIWTARQACSGGTTVGAWFFFTQVAK